ncbi:MAG TPA: CoA pyrophosphatase [Burkholderiales bacterium]|nr:CoA pyrophosphatase [Burkholderiales bacterium]
MLDRDWLASRLAEALDLPLEQGRPEQAFIEPEQAIAAAVLVPLVRRDAGLNVLFTRRTTHLADHAGQISFPGGRVESADVSRKETALREAEEEIGLPRDKVDVLGVLPDYFVVTGFRITPVVGWIEAPFPVRLDRFEVADVFEAPLEFFLDPANHQIHSTIYKGEPRRYYSMPYAGHYIWGATAGILLNLCQALRA